MRMLWLCVSTLCLTMSCTHEAVQAELVPSESHSGLEACGKILEARSPQHPAIVVPGLEVLLFKNGQQVDKQTVVGGNFCFDQLEAGQDYTIVPVLPAKPGLQAMSSSSLIKVNQIYQQPSAWPLLAQVACDPDKNRNIDDRDMLLIRTHVLQTPGAADPCDEWRFYNRDAASMQDVHQVYQLHFPSLQKNLDLTIFGLTGCNPE